MALTADAPTPPSTANAPIIGAGRVDWTGRDVLVGIGWFIAIFIGGQILLIPFAAIYGAKSDATLTSAFIVGAAVEVAIAMVAANLTFRRYGGGWTRLGVKPITGTVLAWAGGAFVAAMAFSFAYAIAIEVFGLDFLKSDCAEQIPTEVRDSRMLMALASLIVIAFAPPCEELFFRGFLFPGIARRWNIWAGIVISGLLFSSAHLIYKSFVPIAGVGIIFAFTYWRSRNIFSTMLAHIAFNSLSIAFIAGGSCDSSGSIAAIHWSLPF